MIRPEVGPIMPIQGSFMTASAGQSLPLAAANSVEANDVNLAAVSPPLPEAAVLEGLREESNRLEAATPEEIVRWAVATYFPKLTMATAFGPEGCAILYYLSLVEPRTHVFNLD